LDVQVGRTTVEFIENAEIDLALPSSQFRLDVPDYQVVLNISDHAVRLDLAVGHGAGNLDQITDLNRMAGQYGTAPGRG